MKSEKFVIRSFSFVQTLHLIMIFNAHVVLAYFTCLDFNKI